MVCQEVYRLEVGLGTRKTPRRGALQGAEKLDHRPAKQKKVTQTSSLQPRQILMYETVIDIKTQKVYEVKSQRDGENYQPCPVCREARKAKNRNKPCLSYNAQ